MPRKSAASDAPQWVVQTLAQVAMFFDVSVSAVKSDWRPNGMPGQPGTYDLREVRRWRDARRRDDSRSPSVTSDRDQAETALIFERHRKLKIQNDLAEQKVVDRDEVLTEAAEVISVVRARLEAIPDEVEMEIPLEHRSSLKQTISNKVYLALRYLADWRPLGKPTVPGTDLDEEADEA